MVKSTGVAKLRAKLSEYLAQVKAGQEVIVTERGRPIARIVPLSHDATELAELALAGLIRIGTRRLPRGFWRMPRPGATRGAGVKALLDDRGDALLP
ncbi:MAG: type II toxin-antitoxin system Phd/YefM family antitoxin [Candidatus Rokuibacteriota bacterium]